MEFLSQDSGTKSVMLRTRDSVSAWATTPKVQDVDSGNNESVVSVLHPVFIIGKTLGFPFQVRFRWLSLRTVWLVIFVSYATILTLLTINDNLRDIRVASLGAISFYFFATTYQFYFLWLSLTWPRLRENWLALEDRMKVMPSVTVNTAVTTVTVSYIIVGLCEHSFSILDNLRQVKTNCALLELGALEMYYRVHYSVVFKHTDYAVWKGALTSFVILTVTVLWTFADVFIITVSMALAARFRQLKLALQQVKGKEMSKEFWKQTREIYLELSFITKQLDDKISLLFFLSLGNNVYSVILMLLNALSTNTNKDYLQTAYYMLSFIFVMMRLVGTCVSAARINDHSKGVLPLLFAVSSSSYSLEVHRFVMQAWYDPLALTAFNFFSITRSTILKIAGSILTYEIVLVQFGMLNANDTVRRPKATCPLVLLTEGIEELLPKNSTQN